MGISGLQSYLERNCPQACYRVSIRQMVEKYKLNNPTVEDVVIVVDGSSCTFYILGETDWVCSGQWREYERNLNKFIEAFQSIGVTLVFFFGSFTILTKPDIWASRRLREFNNVKEIFDCIKQKMPIPTDKFTIPSNAIKLLRIALKYLPGVRVYYNLSGECDQTIASYASQYNCMAILAQDSDFVMYNTAPYLSIQHLDLNTMQTMKYCRESLCKELSLEVSTLPLLGCLLGNDHISRDSLAPFHKSVCQMFARHRSFQRRLNFGQVISSVAKYISSLNLTDYNKEVGSRIQEICSFVFGRSFSSTEFQKTLQLYEISNCDPALYP